MALTIGDLGNPTNTKVETVRYYERIGLMPTPARGAGNYRTYGVAFNSAIGTASAIAR
jgi:DNA-binding transcriptional MerR regulator